MSDHHHQSLIICSGILTATAGLTAPRSIIDLDSGDGVRDPQQTGIVGEGLGERKTFVVYNYIVLAASGTSGSQAASAAAAAAAASYLTSQGVSAADSYDPAFGDHVDNLRGTMFYVCQGSCLCGTVNNRGKVIYCYGDLVPRQGELFAEGGAENGKTSSKDLLAAQLGLWTFGIFALLIVLLLIRRSITSLRRNLQRVTDRLPIYHDDDLISTNSATTPNKEAGGPGGGTASTTGPDGEAMPPSVFSDDGTLTPDDALTDDSPLGFGKLGVAQGKGIPVDKLKTLRLKGKDFKKGGQALRGKNVMDAARVKTKDVKRQMK